MNNNFYIYVYLDPRKKGNYIYGSYSFEYEPFYVGKGRSKRQYSHIKNSRIHSDKNKLKINKINKIKECKLLPIIIKVIENLSEERCFSIEKELISIIGRIDLQKGPLVNLTMGGEGSSGRICSEETKNKISISNNGKTHTTEWRKNHSKLMEGKNNPMYGKSFLKGTTRSKNTLKKQSLTLRSKSKLISINQYDENMNFIKNYIYKYQLKDLGFKNIGKIIECALKNNTDSGKRKMHGYIWKI